ncbi:hypothetical protein SDC9_201263 [bioreactor metagenome]|uniref:Branched-chain-amino-acid transaminase n=1 Tax=bioreactor metagenome TaxID=1076179 RepID=A0A645IT67_9ZZZZ
MGTVLPGITRMSCMELLNQWGYTVDTSRLAIEDVMQADRDGKLEEVFGTGTAAVISPVGELKYKDEVAHIGGGNIGEVTQLPKEDINTRIPKVEPAPDVMEPEPTDEMPLLDDGQHP